MSVLRAIERKIEGLFEGVFGRAFRTHVQPVELARKLAKEMDEHRSVSVSRVYVPNEYNLYLSPTDREQFASYEGSLVGELQEYLSEHARREGYALLTPPRVIVHEDGDLAIGEFGIATRMVELDGANAAEVLPPSLGAQRGSLPAAAVPVETPPVTMIYRSAESVEPPTPPPRRHRRRRWSRFRSTGERCRSPGRERSSGAHASARSVSTMRTSRDSIARFWGRQAAGRWSISVRRTARSSTVGGSIAPG